MATTSTPSVSQDRVADPQVAATAADQSGHSGEELGQLGARANGRAAMAYHLTDQLGQDAYVWWEGDSLVEPVVDASNREFRARLLQALSQPIFVQEDLPDEHGFAVTTRVEVPADDPRYPSQVGFRWHQVGLADLAKVDVVRRDEISHWSQDR